MAEANDIFEETKQQQLRLFKQLAACAVKDVVGVVSPSGVGAGRFQGEELWTVRFSLEIWRIEFGVIQPRPLGVFRSATDAEWDKLKPLIKPYDVVHIKARGVSDSNNESSQVLLEEFVSSCNTDLELSNCSQKMQMPVIIDDPFFGKLALNRRIGQFHGNALWAGNKISLDVSVEEKNSVQSSLENAHLLWRTQEQWNKRILDFAIDELLPLKNDLWLDTDEPPLKAEEFQNRMTLISITVNPDGSFEFWYGDGNMFAGHWIDVYGNLSEGPLSAGIAG
jgi:hypothetical protein